MRILLACMLMVSMAEQKEYKVIGYFSAWAQYRNGQLGKSNFQFLPKHIDPTQYDVLNYAFVGIDKNQQITFLDENDGTTIPQVINLKSQNSKLKIFASIGGWDFSSEKATRGIFSKLSKSREERAAFIRNAVSFCRRYNFDGIDIDWEYPGDEDNEGSKEDVNNFAALMKEFYEYKISEAQSSGKAEILLSAATSSSKEFYGNYKLSETSKYVDWFNVMTYDYHDSDDDRVNSHTPLKSLNSGSESIETTINDYVSQGVPLEKIILGIALYGRGWSLETIVNHNIGDKAIGPSKPGAYTQEEGLMANIEIETRTVNERYDLTAVCKYGWYSNQWFSFDDEITIKLKAKYAKERQLGGVMFWAIDLDPEMRYIKPVIDELKN
ncbi:chitotriosidase-1 precursor, putative [Entamoeba invadens IP1]|uniref:Chitotriosidase-1, putative n=2 Tax=Entamoeba invadens TaxID=33085 RepID=A0A0A1U0K4_ENTIV|nr:chitotriosidase-1 precursor, putative [Entamoeba invadens IP1]ABC59331.1 chitinase 3 [Entamoeba invadens]ELP87420.1 chitotriosidase-1 precursor, putative [Entamoeba invadens IP1]|eukprot:XP_004254191.1 chitotriosidase-1 precursor, putative [Entamoeba invadens IP1]